MILMIKNAIVSVVSLIFLILISCEKDYSSTGKVVFWISQPSNTVNVTIDGTTKNITAYYASGISGCDASGCATFTLDVGKYSYKAEESGFLGYEWEGTVSVTTGGCEQVLLYY